MLTKVPGEWDNLRIKNGESKQKKDENKHSHLDNIQKFRTYITDDPPKK